MRRSNGLFLVLIISLSFLPNISLETDGDQVWSDLKEPDLRRTAQTIFDEMENLTTSGFWSEVLSVADLDNDLFPEIFVKQGIYPFVDDNYDEGFYTFEYNDTNGTFDIHLNRSDLHGGWIEPIDIENDMDFDIIVPSGYLLNDHGNLTYEILEDTSGFALTETDCQDMNADGYFDFIFSYFFDGGVQIALNVKGENFTYQGWDSGIPRVKTNNDPHYRSRESIAADINNDGWPDICAAMGNGNMDKNRYRDSVFYNWISDGKGNWSSYSRGFPKRTYGIDIDLADLDNDGDLDYGLLTPEQLFILENTGKGLWNVHGFFHNASNISRFDFNDIDNDGEIEVVFFTSDVSRMSTHNELFIGDKGNDWTWSFTKQLEFTGGEPGRIEFGDVDLDGDMDVICTFTQIDWDTNTLYNSNITIFYNNGHLVEDMKFTETILSPHVRSGSIHTLAWTVRNATELVEEGPITNLSVSYNGKEGPYYPLQSNILRFWTEIIIPDIPTEKMYIKAECGAKDAVIGPYVVHNSEGATSMIIADIPYEGYNIINGRTELLEISTSRYLPGSDTNIYVNHDGGRYYMGSFWLESNITNIVEWDVPSGILWKNCTLEFRVQTFPDNIIWTFYDNDTFNIIPDEDVPAYIVLSDHDIPQNASSTIEFWVFTYQGINITENCTSSIRSLHPSLYVLPRMNNSFLARSHNRGSFQVEITVYIHGRSFIYIRTLDIHYPLCLIRILSEQTNHFVGQRHDLVLVGYDSFGSTIPIHMFDINWTINGKGVLFHNSEIEISFIAENTSDFSISAEIETPLGKVTDTYHPVFRDIVTDLWISGENQDLLLGRPVSLDLTIYLTSLMNDPVFDVEWNLTGSFIGLNMTDSSIEFIPIKKGNMILSASVSIEEEVYTVSRSYQVVPDIHEVIVGEVPEFILTGEYLNLTFEVLDLEGEPVDVDFFSHLYTDDSMILSPSIERGTLSLYGASIGDCGIYLDVLYMGKIISYETSMRVTRKPSRIELDVPSVLFKNNFGEYPLAVFDHNNESMYEFDVRIISQVNNIIFTSGNITIWPSILGDHNITLIISRNGFNITSPLDFKVVQNACRIQLDRSEHIEYLGGSCPIEITLIDDEGCEISWSDWFLNGDSSVDHQLTQYGMNLLPTRSGEFELIIGCNYHGRLIQSSFNLTIINKVNLGYIELVLHDNDELQVFAFDRDGNDITDICLITWTGDLRQITMDRVDPGEGWIMVEVELDGKVLSEEIDLTSQETGDPENRFPISTIIVALVIMIALIVSSMVILSVFRRARYPEEE